MEILQTPKITNKNNKWFPYTYKLLKGIVAQVLIRKICDYVCGVTHTNARNMNTYGEYGICPLELMNYFDEIWYQKVLHEWNFNQTEPLVYTKL
jgi:hypothetical protein